MTRLIYTPLNFRVTTEILKLAKFKNFTVFLAHLSRSLIGELLVYRGIRRPSVINISNDFFSEAAGQILLIFHI